MNEEIKKIMKFPVPGFTQVEREKRAHLVDQNRHVNLLILANLNLLVVLLIAHVVRNHLVALHRVLAHHLPVHQNPLVVLLQSPHAALLQSPHAALPLLAALLNRLAVAHHLALLNHALHLVRVHPNLPVLQNHVVLHAAVQQLQEK